MAITDKTQNQLIELSVAMLARAPGTTLLNDMAVMSNAGKSIAEIADYLATKDEFKAAFPESATFATTAANFLARIVLWHFINESCNVGGICRYFC